MLANQSLMNKSRVRLHEISHVIAFWLYLNVQRGPSFKVPVFTIQPASQVVQWWWMEIARFLVGIIASITIRICTLYIVDWIRLHNSICT